MDTATQLTPAFEETFDVGRIMKTSEVAVAGAVESTWMACFTLYADLVKLGCMVLFICFTAIEQAQLTNTPELMYLIVVPLVMIAFDAGLLQVSITSLLCIVYTQESNSLYINCANRVQATIKEASERDLKAMGADDEWSSFMVQSAFLRQAITTFRKGFMVTNSFGKIHGSFNSQNFDATWYSKRTQWGAGAIPSIVEAVVLVIVGRSVERGEMSVGAFVVFMSTIASFSPTLGAVIMGIFEVGKGYANILKVASLLNADTRRKQLKRGADRRSRLLAKLLATKPPTWNAGNLILHDVSFRFNKLSTSELPRIHCNVEGGQAVALKGGGSMGKKLVLRLMARHFTPTTGFVYFPSRWRYRFLDASPTFFGGDMNKLQLAAMVGDQALTAAQRASSGTLDYNVKFGMQFKHPDPAALDREIFALLHLLGVSGDLIGASVEEYAGGPHPKKWTLIGLNGEKLSLTNRALLSLARALLSSVDLLLISNVLDLLGPSKVRCFLPRSSTPPRFSAGAGPLPANAEKGLHYSRTGVKLGGALLRTSLLFLKLFSAAGPTRARRAQGCDRSALRAYACHRSRHNPCPPP